MQAPLSPPAPSPLTSPIASSPPSDLPPPPSPPQDGFTVEQYNEAREKMVRAIFSSFEHTRLLLSLATNSLLKVDEASGEVATGWRRGGEQMKLLRMPRRTARWAVERVS